MDFRLSIGLLALLLPVACFDPAPPSDESGSSGNDSTGPDITTTTSDDPDTTAGPITATSVGESSSSGEGLDSTTEAGSESSGGDPVCGDGMVGGDEDCDDAGESATCDADCTPAECGDASINATAGEQCDDGAENGLTRRCSDVCLVGAGLDGTFGMAWQTLPSNGGQSAYGFQSFHYLGQQFLHDTSNNNRFDLALQTWSPIPSVLPYGNTTWANAATEADFLWVPRASSLWRFEIATNTWTEAETGMPNGDSDLTAAVFDGDNGIWWHSSNALARYDVLTGAQLLLPHPDFGDMFETRLGYDPRTNSIVFSGFANTTLVVYSIDTDTFTQAMPNPGGIIRDNTCQDRSGHLYVGSDMMENMMYQFDVETGVFVPLPMLPAPHDNNSSCVVSQEGFLYTYTTNAPQQLMRLPLGTL